MAIQYQQKPPTEEELQEALCAASARLVRPANVAAGEALTEQREASREVQAIERALRRRRRSVRGGAVA